LITLVSVLRFQDLEDEIGVDLLRRSPRGGTLTAEGKLFLEEVRELLKRADESVEKVRALARGEYGELHVGYAPSPHGGDFAAGQIGNDAMY
jgi:DNA-binding transcriptional LysR family regulator